MGFGGFAVRMGIQVIGPISKISGEFSSKWDGQLEKDEAEVRRYGERFVSWGNLWS